MRFDSALACKVCHRGNGTVVLAATLGGGTGLALVLRTNSADTVVGTKEGLTVEVGSIIRGSCVLDGHLFQRTFEPLDG